MSQTVFPVLRYRDAVRAIDFLERAFGFTTTERVENEDGTIAHAELDFRGTRIMLGDTREDTTPRPGASHLYVAVDDPDRHRARALQAGAEVTEIIEQDYGSRDYQAKDLDGNDWSFGTYAPGAT